MEMRSLIGQVAMAAVQVVQVGSEAQVGQAKQLLTDTRKALYRILAARRRGERCRRVTPARCSPPT